VERPKLVLVSFPIGRVGSSATMGLLRLLGLNIGNREELYRVGPANQKGFFEMHPITNFLATVYGSHFGNWTVVPPTVRVAQYNGANHWRQFAGLLKQQFRSKFPAAVKNPHYFLLPMAVALKDSYDIRVVSLSRDIKDQARSIRKVCHRHKLSPVEFYKLRSIVKRVKQWYAFVKVLKQRLPDVNYLDVRFEDLVEDPVYLGKELAKFSGVGFNELSICSWIDKRLVTQTK